MAIVFGGIAAAPTSASPDTMGTLEVRGFLKLTSDPGPCPSGATELLCAARTQVGALPGLGQVSSAYTWVAALGPPECAASSGRVHAYGLRIVIGSKGALDVNMDPGAGCVEQEAVRSQTQTFSVTGGTGAYVGASGSGSVESTLEAETATGRVGRATWKGTLSVPDMDFDTKAPAITGAANKSVKAKKGAKSARVTFAVSAQDDKDGAVGVTCAPKSGSRFPLGRTKVTCEASDSSANTATAAFTVTVRRTR